MLNQNETLEEIINFTDKMYLLESRMRQLLTNGYLFDSNNYFNSIKNLLNEHKHNIRSISHARNIILNENIFEHPVY